MKKSLKLFASILLLASVAACGGGGSSSGSSSSTQTWEQTSGSDAVTSLTSVDNVIGNGPTAVAGDTLTVNYTGWLYESTATNEEGPEFGSSAGTPFAFTLGAGQVISGWDQGLVGMKAGGTRTLIIPASLGYGAAGAGGGAIPAGSALIFTVQLVSVTAPAQ